MHVKKRAGVVDREGLVMNSISILTLNFLKVLRFSFPVPVVDPSARSLLPQKT